MYRFSTCASLLTVVMGCSVNPNALAPVHQADTLANADIEADGVADTATAAPACATPTDCADQDPCTTDSCLPTGSCAHAPTPVGGACDTDGLPCTAEACSSSGQCAYVGLAPATCGIIEAGKPACYLAEAPRPGHPCQVCNPAASQTTWSQLPVDASCGAVQKVCIRHACAADGSCNPAPDPGLCPAPDSDCKAAACDAAFGCNSVALPASTTCTGPDGIACTVESCDGAGACNGKTAFDDSQCDDKVACTTDACNASGCAHSPVLKIRRILQNDLQS